MWMSASSVMTMAHPAGLAAFKPDTCGGGPLDWSPIASAGALSAFCGIFAGFVFAGIVVVIGEKNPAGGDGHASRGLRLLLPCFFGLAVASYLYSLISGELVCLRALTEQLFAGAILAADAIVVIVALAWLLPAFRRNQHGEVSFFRGLILFAAQFSMLMLIVSSVGFTNGVLLHRAAGWSDAMVWLSGLALMLLVWACWHRAPAPAPQAAGPDWRDEVFLNKRATVSAWTTLALGGLLAVASAATVGLPYDWWDAMDAPVVYILGESALLVPGVMVAVAMRALPRA